MPRSTPVQYYRCCACDSRYEIIHTVATSLPFFTPTRQVPVDVLQRLSKMPQAIVAKKPVATHPDMCVESLPRKPHVVAFDDALGALKLAPGAQGLGAVLEGWTDPIGAHDQKVIEVEQAMLQEKELVSDI